MADPQEILNPKRTLKRREADANDLAALIGPAQTPIEQMTQSQFAGQPISPAERARRQQLLIELLRRRQAASQPQ